MVLIITLILAVLLGIVATQSFRIEQKRLKAEEETKRSEEKYKTLVAASTDGTIMLLEREVVYANKILQDLTGFSEPELVEKGLAALFRQPGLGNLIEAMDATTIESGKAGSLEIPLNTKSGDLLDVELIISLMPLGNDYVHVVQLKPLSEDKRKIRLQENLSTDFQTSVLFLSQSVGQFPSHLISCDLSLSIREAALAMSDKGYDAILVCSAGGIPFGIITDEDIRKRVVAENVSPDQPVHGIMTSPIVTISEKAMLYEAISLMQEREISHLGVRNTQGEITSIVSNRELLQIHRYSISLIRKQIEQAKTWQAVAAIGRRIPELTAAIMNSGSEAVNLVRFNAILFDSIVQKLISLALDRLGKPPVPFTFLVLGSAGREEQTLVTDQDNAILFEDVGQKSLEQAKAYFLQVGALVSEWLNSSGYAFCKGKIMASNPEWCQPLGCWKEKFTSWITSSEPQDLLDINIFFDFRAVYGESRLTNDLYRHIQEVIKSHPAFFIYMTGNIQRLKPPLGIFGNILVGATKSQPESFDSKRAMIPLIDIARLYALKEGIRETGTLDRFSRLFNIGMIREDRFEERTEAFKLLMMLRFRHQVEQITKNKVPDNFINPEALSPVEVAMLKKILGQVSEFIAEVSAMFKGGTI